MKILVTGGLGFIGTNFIKYWFKNHPQDSIINFDKITYAANPANLTDIENNPNYQFVKGDICDPAAVDPVMKGIDLVVHFAAESHVDRSIDDPLLFVKTNVLGTYTLLQAALEHKVPHFHHVSTDEVYGTIALDSNQQFNESTHYDPTSPYAASKASSDHFVRAFVKTYKLPATITNCSNNYGPYQHPEKMIPRMITNLINGNKVPIYGQGLNFRDWVFVDDHCRAIELVIQKGRKGETYCVGGLVGQVANIDLVKKVLQLMGKSESNLEFVTDRPAHDNYSVNWQKIKNELGWQPQESLNSGLQKTINWYQDNSGWWQQSKRDAENFYEVISKKR